MQKWVGNSLSQELTKSTLLNPNGPILLSGPPGVGKFGFLQDAILQLLPSECVSVASPDDGIDGIRRIVLESRHVSTNVYRALILRDAHLLSDGAQDGLLKLMESTPPKTNVFLVADDYQILRDPVLSRVRTHLRWGLISPHILFEFTNSKLAVESSFGSFSDCVKASSLSGLDSLFDLSSNKEWPIISLSSSPPKIFKDIGNDRVSRRCVAGVLRLASRLSIHKSHLLWASSSILRHDSVNAHSVWLSAASSALFNRSPWLL